jgi:hypothetical protein
LNWLHPDEITPLHEARNKKHLAHLAADMKQNGWQGRPLLAIEREIARLAGLEKIPCYILHERELIKHGFEAEHGHVEDYERLAILHKVGDETAINLMWQENRS